MSLPDFPLERPPSVAKDAIWIFRSLEYGYIGLDSSSSLCALFPIVGKMPLIGRSAGALRISYQAGVRIQVEDTDSVSNCCIVQLTDDSLRRSFRALTESLGRDLFHVTTVTSQEFARAFALWEHLFQHGRRLSPDEEQGLWGELYLISIFEDVDSLVGRWRGPNAEDYDFLANGIAFEVKTSRRLGRHQLSHAQVTQAREIGRIYLVSIWVGEDFGSGIALPELVDDIALRCSDSMLFEQRLMETGYSHGDRQMYDRAFSPLDGVVVFDMCDVPTVRDVDAGVSSLSYVVQLDASKALADGEDLRVLELLVS